MPENELVILLTHHPLNWLVEKESEDYSTLMERHSIIHLHGHIHKTKIEKKQGITLDFKNQELQAWTRRWNPDSGKWTVYDDDGNNRFPFPMNYTN